MWHPDQGSKLGLAHSETLRYLPATPQLPVAGHHDQRLRLVPNGHFDLAIVIDKEVQSVRIGVQFANAFGRFDDA